MQELEHAAKMTTSSSEKQNYSDDGVEPHVSHGAAVEGIGGLTFDQYTTGGMGRHLGIISTTFLMYDFLNRVV